MQARTSDSPGPAKFPPRDSRGYLSKTYGSWAQCGKPLATKHSGHEAKRSSLAGCLRESRVRERKKILQWRPVPRIPKTFTLRHRSSVKVNLGRGGRRCGQPYNRCDPFTASELPPAPLTPLARRAFTPTWKRTHQDIIIHATEHEKNPNRPFHETTRDDFHRIHSQEKNIVMCWLHD